MEWDAAEGRRVLLGDTSGVLYNPMGSTSAAAAAAAAPAPGNPMTGLVLRPSDDTLDIMGPPQPQQQQQYQQQQQQGDGGYADVAAAAQAAAAAAQQAQAAADAAARMAAAGRGGGTPGGPGPAGRCLFGLLTCVFEPSRLGCCGCAVVLYNHTTSSSRSSNSKGSVAMLTWRRLCRWQW
mgnify:CR=1 FL=1